MEEENKRGNQKDGRTTNKRKERRIEKKREKKKKRIQVHGVRVGETRDKTTCMRSPDHVPFRPLCLVFSQWHFKIPFHTFLSFLSFFSSPYLSLFVFPFSSQRLNVKCNTKREKKRKKNTPNVCLTGVSRIQVLDAVQSNRPGQKFTYILPPCVSDIYASAPCFANS